MNAKRMPFHRCRLRARATLAIPVVALAALAFAATAHASFLVYVCGPNLCRANADGSSQTPLTNDGQQGTANVYGSPSLSRDGTKLAFTFNSQVIVADANAANRGAPFATTAFVARMRPDGGSVAEVEETFSTIPFQVCTYNLDGSGRNCPYGTSSAGWAPDGNLLVSLNAGAPNYNSEIAHCPAAGTAGTCTDVRADDPANDLFDPAVSPDGSTLAVTVASGVGSSTKGHIALYNYATGQFERNLTTGTEDQLPAWSPDGTEVAFTRGSSIYVVGVSDAAGTERQLVAQGTEATWGGPPGTGTSGGGGSSGGTGGTGGTGGGVADAAKRAIVKANRALVRLTCPGASPCSGVIKLEARTRRKRRSVRGSGRRSATRSVRRSKRSAKRGKRSTKKAKRPVKKALIGKSRYHIAAGHHAIVRIRLNRRGKLLIHHAGRHGLEVWLAGKGIKPRALRLSPAHHHKARHRKS